MRFLIPQQNPAEELSSNGMATVYTWKSPSPEWGCYLALRNGGSVDDTFLVWNPVNLLSSEGFFYARGTVPTKRLRSLFTGMDIEQRTVEFDPLAGLPARLGPRIAIADSQLILIQVPQASASEMQFPRIFPVHGNTSVQQTWFSEPWGIEGVAWTDNSEEYEIEFSADSEQKIATK